MFSFENGILLKLVETNDLASPNGAVLGVGKTSLSKVDVIRDNYDWININKSVTEITAGTFEGITVKEISLPNSLVVIGARAFANCAGLETIIIPDSVEVIEREAFYGCQDLKNVYVGTGVIDIEEQTFADCPKLESVIYNSAIPVGVCDNSVSPCSLIGRFVATPYTDKLHPLTSIGLPANVFVGREDIEEIYFPNVTHAIKERAFFGCSSLRHVHGGLNIREVSDYAFANCKRLKSVFLGSSVEKYGEHVFDNCPHMVLTTHPGSLPFAKRDEHHYELNIVPGIGMLDYPVEVMLSFEKVVNFMLDNGSGDEDLFEAAAEMFGEKVSGLPSSRIAEVAYRLDTTEFVVVDGCLMRYNGNDTKVIVPHGVRTIAQYAFYRHLDIEEIVLPTTLRGFSIGDIGEIFVDDCGATFGCLPNLRSITMPLTNRLYAEDGILYGIADGTTYMVACPTAHPESAKHNVFVNTVDILKYDSVVEAMDTLGIVDKVAGVHERLGARTVLSIREVVDLIYGHDLKPIADMITERLLLDHSAKMAEANKNKLTKEQKDAKAFLFGKKGRK